MSEPSPDEWVNAEVARLTALRSTPEIATMASVVAGLVIARTEHARALRKLRADADRHEEDLAVLRRQIGEVRRAAISLRERFDELDPDKVQSYYGTIAEEVDDLEERVDLVEKALPFIERRLGLHRKAGAWRDDEQTPATQAGEPLPPPDLTGE